ncbi:cytochrome ubiquinol oxidase subunit I [Pannonibacter tanglangensis]|uniref:Cytochrome bd-I ubiquinol oxidase subunit CydA n=1 Tax=Pannonibacter tanglangensis TaxID=2750084 RepID=A0ABW9ZGR6_9HYPH|nr:cytochrome ubiquinol oxidase subunit I [Pannonibacter sp. XCT-34]NBN62841.1 cytochrome bd-I ubiquinol oxidase subunit CydA [Pannonibacter sp. XCT-34]
MELNVVDLSRLQFAMTALYHFLFVPLTLGLSVLLAIMETVYVMTGREVWKRMVKFWGTLFGINFVLGVSTGLTMEFQFGMNWSYFSQYVGDVFGAPLAIEGLMAFFLEATFVGLFFFGWDRMSRRGHLAATWAMAMGTNFSALWILIANGWMQHPVGAAFNIDTMRMEVTNFFDVLFNPVAQAKFVHTVSAGYVTASLFVLGISAWYMLKGRHLDIARRSMAVAAAFGFASALSVVVLGDESGYEANLNQKMKLATIEGMWETEPAPAAFNVIAIPDQAKRENLFAIEVPYVMGLIATRSLDTVIPGIKDLVEQSKERIRSGAIAWQALQDIRGGTDTPELRALFKAHAADLGYGYLLLPYTDRPTEATEAQIDEAAWSTVPNVWPMFYAFRIMVACGLFFIVLTAVFFYLTSAGRLEEVRQKHRWLLHVAVWSIPLPWIACEMGWFVAEYGRQPWIIESLLPTSAAASSLSVAEVLMTMAGFIALYSVLLVIEVKLMLKAIAKGPEDLPQPEPGLARRPVAIAAE